jgi:hypothetical protein
MNKSLARNNKSQDRGQSVPAGDGGGASFLLPLKTARLRTRTPSVLTGSTILTVLLHGLINLEGMFKTFAALYVPDTDPTPLARSRRSPRNRRRGFWELLPI